LAATPAAMSKASPAPAVAGSAAPATAEPQPVAEGADVHSLWPRLLEAIGRASQFARSYFIEAHPVSFVKNVFTIGFDPEFADHIAMVDNAKNHGLIAAKLSELGFPGAQVKIIKAERPDNFAAPAAGMTDAPAPAGMNPAAGASTPAAAAPPATKPAASPPAKATALDPAEFKNDPLIRKALEIFKGTIVEVRA
jgi:hypothetical protein